MNRTRFTITRQSYYLYYMYLLPTILETGCCCSKSSPCLLFLLLLRWWLAGWLAVVLIVRLGYNSLGYIGRSFVGWLVSPAGAGGGTKSFHVYSNCLLKSFTTTTTRTVAITENNRTNHKQGAQVQLNSPNLIILHIMDYNTGKNKTRLDSGGGCYLSAKPTL